MSAEQRDLCQRNRRDAVAKRRKLELEARNLKRRKENPFAAALEGATLITTVGGAPRVGGAHDDVPVFPPDPFLEEERNQTTSGTTDVPSAGAAPIASQPAEDGPKWYNFQPETVEEGETAETASLSIPSGAPVHQIRRNLKTRVRRLKCFTKTYAPIVFDGRIGESRKITHATHSLWQARGLVWCSKCGKVGSLNPKGLLIKCPGRPSPFGRRTLERMARGLPPHHLSHWPGTDQGPARRLWTEDQGNPSASSSAHPMPAQEDCASRAEDTSEPDSDEKPPSERIASGG